MITMENQVIVQPQAPGAVGIRPVAVLSRSAPLSRTLPALIPAPALACGLLSGLMLMSLFLAGLQILRPQPLSAWGLTVDRLSAALSLLVAYVGLVTFRFSMRYLQGDARQGRFLAWLAMSVLCAYVLMFSTYLILLALAWSLMGYGLHQLLTHYPDRLEGLRAARKKFLISRIGDLALAAAIATIWLQWHTLDLRTLLADTQRLQGQSATTWVALLITLAALTKSAQFPFHSWLPETMESPTPVSALMHAGIINAGGALLLRLAPLVIQAPAALLLLAVVGTLTAVLGTLSMWAQVKVKRTLAWSTVGQMGFMMVQCGLGAFPAALLHILAHGCYKAWSFLRSGEVPAASHPHAAVPATRRLLLAIAGTLAAIPSLFFAAWITGFSPLHAPGELALTAVVALSLGQVLALMCTVPGSGKSVASRVVAALAAWLFAPLAAFALYRAAGMYLLPVMGELPAPGGPAAWAAALLPITGLLFLIVIHALLTTSNPSPQVLALRVHALHGFYFGALADRLVAWLWPVASTGDKHAH